MLDKLSGKWAPRPSTGPHKLRECLPLILLLRNRLKYALTYKEAKLIVMQKLVKVDGKVRTDICFPAGFMDVIQIEKTKEMFRLLYSTKGRFAIHRVKKDEASFKLCKVRKIMMGANSVKYAVTHDARTLKFPDPTVKENDTIKVDLATGEMTGLLKMEVGNMVMATGGNNIGRVGQITSIEKHLGRKPIVHIKDKVGHSFNTTMNNVFVIGTGSTPSVSLPKGDGIKLSIMEDVQRKLQARQDASSHRSSKRKAHKA